MIVQEILILTIFIASFFVIAESVYWVSRKQYLEAKAKYLRNVIHHKDTLTDPNHEFYSCVYNKWGSSKMNLSNAVNACTNPNLESSKYNN